MPEVIVIVTVTPQPERPGQLVVAERWASAADLAAHAASAHIAAVRAPLAGRLEVPTGIPTPAPIAGGDSTRGALAAGR